MFVNVYWLTTIMMIRSHFRNVNLLVMQHVKEPDIIPSSYDDVSLGQCLSRS